MQPEQKKAMAKAVGPGHRGGTQKQSNGWKAAQETTQMYARVADLERVTTIGGKKGCMKCLPQSAVR
jgi:hypothetical protein